MRTTTGSRLSLKRERFIAEYLLDGNGSAAYQRAGYKATGNASETGGCRLLRNAQVKEAITAAHHELLRKTELDAAWVESRLMSAVARCLEAEPFDAAGALKGLELLAKRLRLFSGEPEQGEPEQSLFLNLPPPLLLAWAARIRAREQNAACQDRESLQVPPPDAPPLGDPPDDLPDAPPLDDPPLDPPPDVPPPNDAPPEDAPPPAPPLDPPNDVPPLKTNRAQLLARLLTPSGLPPQLCTFCGSVFRPEMTEKCCCYACVCRAQGKPHRVKGHTADCRRVLPNV